MLRSFIVAILCLMTFSLHAQEAAEQETSRDLLIGGSVNFLVQNNSYPLSALGVVSGIGGIGGIYSDGTEDIKNTSLTFNPYLAKDIRSNGTIGLQLNVAFADYKRDNINTPGQPTGLAFNRKSRQLGANLFYRHTFNDDGKLNFFLQPNGGYNVLKEEESYDTISSGTQKAWFLHMALDLGLLFNFNDRLRATARIGALSYATGKWNIEGTLIEKGFNTFQTNLRLSSVFFGLEWRI